MKFYNILKLCCVVVTFDKVVRLIQQSYVVKNTR